MKELVIISGKGGTGKTTVASSFVKLSKNKAFADCDVDAPNLHLTFSQGKCLKNINYEGYKKAYKDYDACIHCNKCEDLCRFDAIKNGILNPLYCEGCGVCEYFCPSIKPDGTKAISLKDNVSGEIKLINHNNSVFSTATLKMGNGASGKLVTEVRKIVRNEIKDEEFIIIDGSPGIGCPVIASITGVTMALIVTEPTISGFADMKRIIDTALKFNTKVIVCINKFDISIKNSSEIEQYLLENNIQLIGKIPFDKTVSSEINKGNTIIDNKDSLASREVTEIWKKVCQII